MVLQGKPSRQINKNIHFQPSRAMKGFEDRENGTSRMKGGELFV